MIVLITKVKARPFDGDDGEKIPYFWTKATRKSDGVTIEFGGRVDHTEDLDKELDLDIEKTERANGKFGYKEILED